MLIMINQYWPFLNRVFIKLLSPSRSMPTFPWALDDSPTPRRRAGWVLWFFFLACKLLVISSQTWLYIWLYMIIYDYIMFYPHKSSHESSWIPINQVYGVPKTKISAVSRAFFTGCRGWVRRWWWHRDSKHHRGSAAIWKSHLRQKPAPWSDVRRWRCRWRWLPW